jgi:glycosyltransferase involved in cell wall biosynthesis
MNAQALPLKETESSVSQSNSAHVPVSVIIAVRNEERNLPRCLAALGGFGEVCVIDSQSTDRTEEMAHSSGARVVQFHYQGGWPKKRQWAIDTLPLQYDWVLLLDADEIMTPELRDEIAAAIQDPSCFGYSAALRMSFLGRTLRHCDATFWKTILFRRGMGHYECRLRDQDPSMADMEVHEHVVIEGGARRLRNTLVHRNLESLGRYIEKHNEYSNWESRVLAANESNGDLAPSPFGSQAQRRRWLKKKLFRVPGSPVALFLYRYVLRMGFLDGVPGLIYCCFQAIQMFHTKAKIYESHVLQSEAKNRRMLV